MATFQTVAGATSGDDTITTDLLKEFFIDALTGDDEITVTETASNFQVLGSGGEDTITANSDISNADKIKGGAESDTFDFEGAVTNSSIYGGKGADSFYFARTLTGGVVAGDTGNDTFRMLGKVSGGAKVDGGAGDDSFIINERFSDSTILGGDARDSIDINENSASSKIDSGSDNDAILISGKHTDLIGKTSAGDDTITIELGLSGSNNKFYAGKGEDSISIGSVARVAVYADNDDDFVAFAGAIVQTGASVYGGGGDDTIDANTLTNGSEFFIKGNAGADTIRGAGADSTETIYGGQGADTIVTGGGNGAREYYGDADADVITLFSNVGSLVDGGTGDDDIIVSTRSGEAKNPHSITGGAGVDTIFVEGTATGNQAAFYAPEDDTSELNYSTFAEFYAQGDIVDSINVETNGEAVIANVAGALTFTDSDEFDRFRIAGTARDAEEEGLIIKTTSTVTAGSTVTISKTAPNEGLFGIDLSAGTTGQSTIDASAEDDTTLGMLLKGGDGKNTIKGTAGPDVIYGGVKNDVIEANGEADIINAGTGGKDNIKGGAANDTIIFTSDLDTLDTVDGGLGTDSLSYKAAVATTSTDLDNVSDVETIALGNAATKIVLKDTFLSAAGNFTIDATALTSSTSTLNLDADAENEGTLIAIGGSQNDTVKGTDEGDTISGLAGSDSLFGGTGADHFGYAATSEGTDTIADFTVADDLFQIADGIINPAGTANNNAFVALDFESTSTIATIVTADTLHAILITQSQTTANIAASVGGQTANAVVVVHDSDLGYARLVYDTDWSDPGNRVYLADLTGLTTAGALAGIDHTNFYNVA